MECEKTEPKVKFTLKKWNAVAVWSWITDIENCSICKQFLNEACPICADLDEETAKGCRPIWGECSHPYHEHCIEEWLKKNKNCPLCAREFRKK